MYEKGEAAWSTGHRAGATQSAWAKARVYSFLSKGKTATTADADLYIKAIKKLFAMMDSMKQEINELKIKEEVRSLRNGKD